MAVPILTGISSNRGSTAGGEILYVSGTDFAEHVSVLFGDVPSEVIVVRESAGQWTVDLKTPNHAPAVVDVRLVNLGADGIPIPGEASILSTAYRFVGAELVTESDLTRLIRTLLRMIKKQIIDNTGISVSVDYDNTVVDGLQAAVHCALRPRGE